MDQCKYPLDIYAYLHEHGILVNKSRFAFSAKVTRYVYAFFILTVSLPGIIGRNPRWATKNVCHQLAPPTSIPICYCISATCRYL